MYFNFHFRSSLNKLTYMQRCRCPVFFILVVLTCPCQCRVKCLCRSPCSIATL